MNDRWKFVERAIAELQGGALPNNLDAVISERLETALASPGTRRLEEMQEHLAPLVDALVAALPAHAVESLRTGDRTESLLQLLGATSFAHMVATTYARRRDDGRALRAIEDPENHRLLNALHEERRLAELPRHAHLLEEIVHEKLLAFSRLGIVTHRIENREAVWMLTPMAMVMVIEAIREHRTSTALETSLETMNHFASPDFEKRLQDGMVDGELINDIRNRSIESANALRSALNARAMHRAFSRPKDED